MYLIKTQGPRIKIADISQGGSELPGQTNKLNNANSLTKWWCINMKKTALVINITILYSNIRKMEHEKLQKYQGRTTENVESKGNRGARSDRGTGGSNPQDGCMAQIRGTSHSSVQKSAMLGAAKILYRTLKLADLWWRTLT